MKVAQPNLQHRRLSVCILDNATVHVGPSNYAKRYNSGVIAADGAVVPLGNLQRGRKIIGTPRTNGGVAPTGDAIDHAIYAGPHFQSFGHFIIEGLARLWCAAEHPNAEILFSNDAGLDLTAAELTPWQKQIFSLLGIANPIRIVASPTRVRQLIVPEPGFVARNHVVEQHLRFLARHRVDMPHGEKVWLSRAGLSEHEKLFSERVESALNDCGWRIFHPERHTVKSQLDVVGGASRLAGPEGSAFHSLLLLNGCLPKFVDIFVRNPTAGIHANYCIQSRSQDYLLNTHSVWNEAILSARSSKVKKLPPSKAPYLRALGESGHDKTKKETCMPSENESSRRINRIAEIMDAENYLEIGVNKGETFINVDIDRKVAVDPKFKFAFEDFDSQSTIFYEWSSDVFFRRFARKHAPFDIIFLDGLHTFEQTFRDFCASQAIAHERTVWLIDDVVPTDIFSSHSRQSEAVKYRKAHGIRKRAGAWSGDVYKVMFGIRDFFPGYDFRTIADGSKEQALVVRSTGAHEEPLFDSIEAISRLNWFQLQPLIGELRLSEEAEVWRWLSAFSSETKRASTP